MNPKETQTPRNTDDGTGRLNKVSYRDGYLHGRDLEQRTQEENRVIRENNSAATGLLLGITIAAIASFVGGTLFFLSQTNQQRTTPVQTVPVPNSVQPQSAPKQTTVIERTINTTKEVVPVPQQQAPTQPATSSSEPVSPTQPETTAPDNESAQSTD